MENTSGRMQKNYQGGGDTNIQSQTLPSRNSPSSGGDKSQLTLTRWGEDSPRRGSDKAPDGLEEGRSWGGEGARATEA